MSRENAQYERLFLLFLTRANTDVLNASKEVRRRVDKGESFSLLLLSGWLGFLLGNGVALGFLCSKAAG